MSELLPRHIHRDAPALANALATSQFCSKALLPFDFCPPSQSRFRAGGKVKPLGKASLIGMWSEGDYWAHRSSKDDDDEVLLSLCLQGDMKLQASRTFHASRGQWFLARTADYQTLEAHQPITTLTLRFPKQWLCDCAPSLIRYLENPTPSSSGLSHCVQHLLLSYWRNATELDQSDAYPMVNSILTLAEQHYQSNDSQSAPLSLSAQEHLKKLRQTLRQWVAQHPLDHHRLAAKLGLSVRGLQAAMTRCNTSLSMEIRRARMTKAEEMLRDNPNGRRSLTDIALDLGYSDLASFSRHFKHHFGVAPSRYKP